MKKALTVALALTLCLSFVGLVGCGGGGGTGGGNSGEGGGGLFSSEPTLEGTELQWGNYTMGIDQVTDDPEDLASTQSEDVEGRLVRVCFFYISDTNNSTGFVSESFFSDLTDYPITLRDADGNTYEYNGSIGHVAITTSSDTGGFGLAEFQDRFSINFDVPEDVALEDLVLETGDGQEIKLMSYTSAAYEEDYPKDEDKD